MLMRVLVFAGLTAVIATQVPAYLQSRAPTEPAVASHQPVNLSTPIASVSGQAILEADNRGHFTASFRINGKPVEAMIDTGATSVAINETTARKLGLGGQSLDFKYKVTTANGTIPAARVVLDRVELASVRVDNVEAMVLRDKALSDTLIGMSFLSKLGSYKVEAGRLKLSQK